MMNYISIHQSAATFNSNVLVSLLSYCIYNIASKYKEAALHILAELGATLPSS